MFSSFRMLARVLVCAALALLLWPPLGAQVDPRLRPDSGVSTTDFLDLYQQSNLSVKPEILTIFDFSGSMQSLMFHPCFYNTDLTDNSDTTGIVFQLTGAPNSFQVTATVGPSSWGYTSTQLIRPDGSLVTEANINANMTSQTPRLWGDKNDTGAGTWACDVRNWVRSASHIRVTSGSRTVDLPIPWKVMDASSTGYPLSSMTVKDRYQEYDKSGILHTYGSGDDIEVDTRYKVQEFPTGTTQNIIDNNRVLSGDKTLVVTRTKFMIRLSKYYLDWIFSGTYQGTDSTRPDYNTALAGKYIVFDAASLTPGGTAVGLQADLKQGQGFGTFEAPYDALKAMVLPGRDRVQAVKEAAIRTWINYQTRVFWAFRFLDDVGEAGNDGHGNATLTTINNNSTTSIDTSNPTTSWMKGRDTGWTCLNGNSVSGMQRLAALFPYTNTPLAYAVARGLAQFSDPNNVFKGVETSPYPLDCQKRFLILFTDGVPTVDNYSENHPNTPYISDNATGTGTAQTGNVSLIANKPGINPGADWWNIFTLAGAAAHLGDSTKTAYTLDTPITTFMTTPTNYPNSSSAPSAFLPFAVTANARGTGASIQGTYRLITTMTVGVSLAGQVTDAASPKRRLFLTAALGDPSRTSWVANNLTAYTLADPTTPSLGKTASSTYFFDATNPDLLIKSLGYAFAETTSGGQTGVTSSPNLPFIGASVGKQIYIGKFKPPAGGGVLWGGDLLMFPTKVDSSNSTVILDSTGKPTTTLNNTTAAWSAADSLPTWSSRTLLTRIENSTSLSPFNWSGPEYTDSTSGLKNYVAQSSAYSSTYPAGSAAQQSLIKMVMGANAQDSSKNRSDIMGDIINSAPAYLEYDTSSLPTSMGAFTANQRFRIILVGTNQGWLHAFGETTTISKVSDPTVTINPPKIDLVSGSVKELWAFMPTDFLKHLGYLNDSSNSHKFMVDGSPSIYFLDLPASSGGTGNGKLDGASDGITPATDTTHERAFAIIGLRKGGRSYYALNLHNPIAPTLQWALVPDEASQIPASRNLTGLPLTTLQAIVGNMGYSSCTPSYGRVLYNGVYKDVVFLGGGLSLPEVERNSTFNGSLLGRSVLALDVNTGNILAAVDLTDSSIVGTNPIGPVASGLVPFEFFLGSGMTQRAYFLDYWGGLWSWGSKNVVPGASTVESEKPYLNFRKDTSEFQAWSNDGSQKSPYANTGIRKVYQDANVSVTANSGSPTTYTVTGPKYSTLPSPFLLGSFPGKGKTYVSGTTVTPAAVGIAMVSGDRNDPLDYGAHLSNSRLTVVFDRQDSRGWGFDSASGPDSGINSNGQLLAAGQWGTGGNISSTLSSTSPSLTPGSSTYYLAPDTLADQKYGYYIAFPDASNAHYSKGITMPLVVSNTLYYSYFTPTDVDICSGGSGLTYSNKICDVMKPVARDTTTGLTCTSGWVDTWWNVASEFTMLGTPGVMQVGTRTSTDSNGVTTVTTDAKSYTGQTRSSVPRVRVWRTVR